VEEQVIDLRHKAIYAFVTGAVADQLIGGGEQRQSSAWEWSTSRATTVLHATTVPQEANGVHRRAGEPRAMRFLNL
jgi:hypothetical protein